MGLIDISTLSPKLSGNRIKWPSLTSENSQTD